MIAAAPEASFRPPLYASPQRVIDGQLPPTMGPRVAAWMERFLVHGEGDFLGRPVRLAPHQRYVLNRLYEYDPATGLLLHDRVLIGMAKGNSKTEDAARIALAEIAGPAAPLASPHVVVSAASYDQADNVFGAAKTAIEKGPLRDYFQLFDTELRPLDGDALLERIAARGGTAEGKLPTCHVGDELHEWINPGQVKVYTVQGQGLRKRQVPRRGVAEGLPQLAGPLQISISTAGDDLDSLLGRLYLHGRQVASGEVEDPGFLMLWWEAERVEEEDLDDADQLRAALLAANPGAGHFLSVGQKIRTYHDPTIERHDFERRDLNRWVTRARAWIGEATWKSRTADDPSAPADGSAVVVGFKGSYNRHATAVVGWTADDYGFLIRVWERPQNAGDDWSVPREEVDAEIAAAMRRWRVQELACCPAGWASEVEAWEKEYGVAGSGGVVLRFETHVSARMAPAVDGFRAAVVDPAATLTHDGSPAFARHVANCDAENSRHGTMLAPDARNPMSKYIDITLAAVIARARAMRTAEPSRHPVILGAI